MGITGPSTQPSNNPLGYNNYDIQYAGYNATSQSSTMTVHYVDSQGNQLMPDATDTVTVVRVTDSWGASQDFYQVGSVLLSYATLQVAATTAADASWTVTGTDTFGSVRTPSKVGWHWLSTTDSANDPTQTFGPVISYGALNPDFTVTFAQDSYTVSLTKVAEVIHYVDTSGKTIAPDSLQYLTFATVTDEQTGEVSDYYQAGDHSADTVTSTDGTLAGPWVAGSNSAFAAVANPALSGYNWQSSTRSGDTSNGTSSLAVSLGDADAQITVTYAPVVVPPVVTPPVVTPPAGPNTPDTSTIYVDGDGKQIAPPVSGKQPPKDIPGYTYLYSKTIDGVTYHYYQKNAAAIAPANPGNSAGHSNGNSTGNKASTLPDTGDNANLLASLMGAGLSVAVMAFALGRLKDSRKKKKA